MRIASGLGQTLLKVFVLIANGADQMISLGRSAQEGKNGQTVVDFLLNLGSACLNPVILGFKGSPRAFGRSGQVEDDLISGLADTWTSVGEVLPKQFLLLGVLVQVGHDVAVVNPLGALPGPALTEMSLPAAQFGGLGCAEAGLEVTAGQCPNEGFISFFDAGVQTVKHFLLLEVVATEPGLGGEGSIVGIGVAVGLTLMTGLGEVFRMISLLDFHCEGVIQFARWAGNGQSGGGQKKDEIFRHFVMSLCWKKIAN